MSTQVTEIVGFDLGHGETAVARAKVESIETPQMLEINNKKVQITAIGLHPDLGILVGEQALISAGVSHLQIGFKQKPNPEANYRQTIRNFVSTYYHLLKESRQIEVGNNTSHFYIGCPSGWSISEREEYQKLLKEADIGLVSVVPESRAALMQAKEAGKLDYDEIKSALLLIDIGSSTTDFTLVKSLSEFPLDFGRNTLGASLIDKSILARTLANHEQRTLLEKVFESHPHHKLRCELQCRKAKEDYFSNELLYSNPESFARGFESISPQLFFIPQVNKAMMAEILNQPMPELEHKSWVQAFREAVSEAKEKLAIQGIVPEVLLMTGGASRMQFTHQICQEIFPESELRPDPEPERAIALGLARVGRWELRAAAFKEEVNLLCDSNKLKAIIEKHIPALIELLVEPLSTGTIANVVKPGLQDWRSNKIRTWAELETELEKQAEQWLKSDRAQQIINTKCATWFNSNIQPDLAAETDPICQKFQISKSSLRFESDINPAIVNPELSIGDDILAAIATLIVSLVIAGGTIGSIIALLLTGHLILPIALVYGAALFGEGVRLNREKIEDTIKKQVDVPGWIRSISLQDKAIENICDKMQPELEQGLKEQMANKRETFDELIGKVGQELKKALHSKAEEAIILIR